MPIQIADINQVMSPPAATYGASVIGNYANNNIAVGNYKTITGKDLSIFMLSVELGYTTAAKMEAYLTASGTKYVDNGITMPAVDAMRLVSSTNHPSWQAMGGPAYDPKAHLTVGPYTDAVEKAYIAYYGRPADPTGLTYWEREIAKTGSLDGIMQQFGSAPESQALYGNASTTSKITNIYQQLLGRAPEAAGLTYWVDQVDTGKSTNQTVALTLLNGALGSDALVVSNKLQVAEAFTGYINYTGSVAYDGNTAAGNARTFLSSVTADATTVVSAYEIAYTVLGDIQSSNVSADLLLVGLYPSTVL